VVRWIQNPPTLIENLECGMIPLREFPLRKWYYVSPLWYYHAPSTEHRLRLNPKFFELVDPQLRDLCAAALAAGLCTTPSCQGHFYPRSRFEAIWIGLQEDASQIRAKGLALTDAETQEKRVFRQGGWELPWDSFADFYREVNDAQAHGYIGLAVPHERASLVRRLQDNAFDFGAARIELDEDLSERLDCALFGVYVSAATPNENAEAWAAVTAYLKDAFGACGRLRELELSTNRR
jgi:hypothetical protein